MAFVRPTLSDLVDRIRSDFRARLGISGSLLRRAMADVLATTWAGAVHLVHGQQEWLAEQLFADTADREYLIRKAAIWGITPTPATYATGTTVATGTDPTVIPVDTILVRDDGAEFKVTTEATITGGTADVAVQAVLAGADGNTEVGAILTFESPIAGVDSDTTVKDDGSGAGLSNGNDEESTEDLRTRFLQRLRETPEGGSDSDYVAWALAVAGVTRVWVYRHENGLGTVVVRFVRDNDVDIFPSAAEVAAVQAAIDPERPVTAEVTVVAPTELSQAFTVAVTPDTTAVRAAVQAELDDLMAREGEPGDGAGRGTILISAIRTAIGIAEGLEDYTLTVPAADVVPAVGQLVTRGTITWA